MNKLNRTSPVGSGALLGISDIKSNKMKSESEKLNECADWHDDAAGRLEQAVGAGDQSADSANKSWAEQHRRWAKSIRVAAMPNGLPEPSRHDDARKTK